MKTITIINNSIYGWKSRTILVFLIVSSLIFQSVKAQTDFECDIDSLFFENYENYSEAAFVSSTFGNVFTPKGDLRILVIYAGFTNDNNKIGGVNPNTGDTTVSIWPYYDMNGDSLNTFPTNINETFYTNINQFSPTNTDKSISNYYYQMSLPSGNPLKIVADVFPERINVPADIVNDNSGFGGWWNYSNWVMDSIAVKYPNYDWSPYDNRKNQPAYAFDNTDTVNYPPDNIVDYVVLVFRYNNQTCALDPNPPLLPQYPNTLCKNPYSNTSVANIPFKAFTDSLSNTYQIKHGYTTFSGINGLGRTAFYHELGHQLYNSPHYNAANGLVGRQFYTNFGWGMMKSGGPHVFETALAWERWYLGWIELTTGATQINTQIDTITDIQNGGIYILKDFATTGDVIRIKLPYVINQYLWLENHQGKNTFDNREGFIFNGTSDSLPKAPRGLGVYIENLAQSRLNGIGVASQHTNKFKYLNKNGHFDYSNQYSDPEPTAPEVWNGVTYNFVRNEINPLSPHSPNALLRNDFISAPTINKIDYHDHYNNNTSNGVKNEHRIVYKEDGGFTYGAFGNNMMFTVGDTIDLGSNPAIANIQYFNKVNDTLSPIFLNGISVKILSFNIDSSLTVKISMDDYNVNNDTRYTGNIILSPNIVNSSNYSLNLKPGKTLKIDKSGTSNKQFITANNDFVDPTVLTLQTGSYFHVEQNATVNVQNNSTLHLKSGSKMELESGARLHLFAGTTLIIDDGAELILKPGAILIIEEGATVYYNNNQSGKGLLVGATSISGNAARVEVKGKIIFDANATWVHNRDGYYHFFPVHQLIIPSTVVMNFTGKNKTHKFIELAPNTTLMLTDISVTLNVGMIFYNFNTHIYLDNVALTSVASTYNPLTNPNNTSIGLIIENPVSFFINGCDFNQLQNGITVSNGTSLTPYTLQSTNFNTVLDRCVELANVHALNITGGVFQSANIGVFGSANVLTITNTEIKSMNYGVHLSETSGAYFSNAKIHINNIGIFTDASLVFLRNGTKVYDNVGNGLELYGVYNSVTRSFTSMLTVGDLGCGSIYNNGNNGVYAKNTILNIDAIQHSINRGDANVIPNQFYGNTNLMFDVCYSFGARSPSQINAKGNYWGASVITPSEYSIVGNGCPGEFGNPQNIALVTTSHSTCFSATSCMNCASGGGSSSSMLVNEETPSVESVVQEAFTVANLPFIV
ncbi:MAG: hypothetical protein CVT95_07575, partial [Bacteroidetes bacterium HGW-Bacteroidetes-12]